MMFGFGEVFSLLGEKADDSYSDASKNSSTVCRGDSGCG
jgi:hypothetical protein